MTSAVASPAAVPRKGGFHRFWRALKQLMLELVGAAFVFIGLIWLNAALRSWNRDTAHWLVAAAIAFAVLFFFFAASSFRRARKL
jgi:hypothetical protein